MNREVRLWTVGVLSLALGACPLFAATTFDELKTEVAADGTTVYIENDMEVTGQLPVYGGFTVPEAVGTGVGKWIVRVKRSATGVTAYELDWTKSGVALIIR